MNSLLLSLAVLSVTVAVTYGVEVTCYNCVSILGLNPDCEADPFNPNATSSSDTTTCDGYCTKSFSKVDGTITELTRTCEATCDDPGCTSFFSLSGCDHCCEEDYCNGASYVTLNRIAVLSSAVMLLTVWRL